MTLALAFWILMFLWFIGHGIVVNWEWRAVGINFVPWLLFLLLGWKVFGAPIHGG